MKQQISLLFLAAALFANAQNTDYKKSPNSYIYDLDLAGSNNYGGLEIPVKKAYEMWASYKYLKENNQSQPIPAGSQSASLYWEDVPGLVENVSVISGGSAEDSKLKVNISNGKGKGNAVIAFKVNNTIYWSWHIWVTDNPTNGVTYSQGFETDLAGKPVEIKYMDRNLGAATGDFIGNNWQKSGGLLYEWGRKDPFPALVNKDFSFYEIDGEVGNLKHRVISPEQNIPMKVREFDDIERNMAYAVKNPITLILNTDNANWFSSKLHNIPGAGTNFTAWDLWSDNYRGGNSNASSSNAALRNDSRSYELKSELDPCPDGWRVPSHYARVAANNNLSPWGRKNSGVNDDASGGGLVNPNKSNPALDGIKVYPGLGMDFTNAQGGNRNIGKMPITGNYVYYPNSVAPNTAIYSIYQDENASGGLWTGTYGYDGPRILGVISDAERKDKSAAGFNGIFINQTGKSKDAMAVRCMRDPNANLIGNFPTQYFSDTKENYTTGLNNPNSYLLSNEESVTVPISKAFSVYNQVLTESQNLPANNLVVKVLWTDNPALITSIKLDAKKGDPRDGSINLDFGKGQYGNAVVSLHNNSTDTPAYWSWHIWKTEADPTSEPIVYTTESTIINDPAIINTTKSNLAPLTTYFMDRNLGALAQIDINANPRTQKDIAIKAAGLQYQWGRKDPVPTFLPESGLSGQRARNIFIGEENPSGSKLSYSKITSLQYEQNYSAKLSTYASNNNSDIAKVSENVIYSINNPLVFMYQEGFGQLYDGGNKSNNDLSDIKDWVSDSRAKAPERWGHADKKSIYDPCPEGWRVPDVSYTALYTLAKGTSPWYNGDTKDQYGKDGLIQDQATAISYYGGTNYNGLAADFKSKNFNIGTFPYAGIRGELGENKLTYDRSGVWTAAMADRGTGYALAMEFNQNSVQTATGVYPQAAMSVRCAFDDKRLYGDNIPGKKNSPKPEISQPAVSYFINADIYPNPFQNKIFAKTDSKSTYEIYDMGGRIIKNGTLKNNEIDTTNLLVGIYILKITKGDGSIMTKKMLKN